MGPKESLEGIPIFNNNVSFEPGNENENGYKIVVINPKAKTTGIRKFGPSVPRRDFQLDELGTFVVQRIDGEHSAKEIIDAFIKQYNVNRREAELSVIQFLKMLTRKQIISIMMK